MDPELWADEPYARAHWANAPENSGTLLSILRAAHRTVASYAPTLPAGAAVPDSYKLAEVYQARALWEAGQRTGDVIGFEDAGAVRVRPIDPTVKVLLRPPSGRLVTG